MLKIYRVFTYSLLICLTLISSGMKAQSLDDIVINIPAHLKQLGINSFDKKAHLTIVQNISKGLIGVTYLEESQAHELSSLIDNYVDLSTRLIIDAKDSIIEIEHWDINNLIPVFKHENKRLERELIQHIGIEEFSRIQKPSSLQLSLQTYSKLFTREVKKNVDNKLRPQLSSIGTLLFSGSDVSVLTQQDKRFQLFIKTLLNEYYRDIPEKWIANASLDLISMGAVEIRMSDVVKILLKNSGPIFGKTIQMIARDPRFSSKLTHMISIIEDSGKKVPRALVLNQIKSDGDAYSIKKLGSKQFAGTVAYTQEAYLETGERVALRAIKPNMKDMLNSELVIYRKVLEEFSKLPELKSEDLPNLDKIVSMLENLVIEDLDITKARLNHQEMYLYYQESIETNLKHLKQVNLRLPIYYPPNNNLPTSFQVSEFISNGLKLSKFVETQALLRSKDTAMSLAKFWYRKAFIDKEMKFHADLHQGNFTLIDKGEGVVEVVFFDSGLIGQTTRAHIQAFLKISLGVKFESSKLLVNGFSGILNLDHQSKSRTLKDLKAKVEAQLIKRRSMIKEGISTQPMKLGEWVGWLVQGGYDVDDRMNKLARGQVMIGQVLTKAGGKELRLQGQKELVKILAKNMLWKTRALIPTLTSSLWTVGLDKCSKLFRIVK